jgi:hypothetical protein
LFKKAAYVITEQRVFSAWREGQNKNHRSKGKLEVWSVLMQWFEILDGRGRQKIGRSKAAFLVGIWAEGKAGR